MNPSGSSVLREATLSNAGAGAQPPGSALSLDPKITLGPEGDLYVSQFSGGGRDFPNPFNDIASLSQPVNMRSALYWAEYIMAPYTTRKPIFVDR